MRLELSMVRTMGLTGQLSNLFVVSSDLAQSALAHPELVDQHTLAPPAVLVVADTLAQDVDDVPCNEGHQGCPIDDVPVDPFPQLAGGVGIRRLRGKRARDLAVDLPVAELGGVPVRLGIRPERRARDRWDEERGRNRVIACPGPVADLRLCPRV